MVILISTIALNICIIINPKLTKNLSNLVPELYAGIHLVDNMFLKRKIFKLIYIYGLNHLETRVFCSVLLALFILLFAFDFYFWRVVYRAYHYMQHHIRNKDKTKAVSIEESIDSEED